MAGWIKIHRDINQHWIFHDADKFKWWIDLILMASYEDNKTLVGDRLIEVKRGQQIISLSFLSKRWGKAKGTILKFLELLESDKMIERFVDRKVTILTICKYESYQESEKQLLTDVRTDCLPIADRLLTELKKGEEIKEYIDNTKAHAYTREEIFVQQYRQENRWSEAAMMAHLKLDEVKSIFEEFLIEQSHNSTTHSDYPDFKRHFLNYLRTKAEILRKQSKVNNNGNQRKYDDRRGTEVDSSANYFKPL